MAQLTLTVGDIVGGQVALMSIADKELPAVTAWRLAKASRVLVPEIEAYEKVRVDLVKQYGKELEDGNWNVSKENIEEYQEEIRKVLEQEVVVDFPLISLEMLGDGAFKARDLALAWFLFEEEHNESNPTDKEGQ